ncbi:hypothetical protein EWJ51_07630 [Salmonella enterica subsp. enterica serovar Newport]|nr:hypothetical protein [Salmonella enterica subsp. enterica serovar Newport]EBX4757946.1 hypothetical protein [Salmonella enterica subsp. enterica serovar Newport]ECE8985990.1 hypothetical protein [Salmonella enterica subsp. enterica serovar Newport]ECF1473570.1 hypothetical protein [Salmonella enterica subsp. enterica serovar Newport]ECF3850214.1 hypothetical protein [Salmonella enterica subsp. enterica serovar Newport]
MFPAPVLQLATTECVFPAPAGINRGLVNISLTDYGVPRASGDKPPENYLYRRLDMCSPRQRG